MENILHIISNEHLVLVHQILCDRYTNRLGYACTNFDELQLVKKEMQRRIDAIDNPYDRLPTDHLINANI